ncbi:ROK family transcriptional regulator [Alicyclobacillaceae bacterium I2511]|nr:ROK family transcriptional regulator [Alicyclobacillaceae bacterium I2511]
MHGVTPQEELKRHNETFILDLIREYGPVSRAQLTLKTGLSAQTITNVVRRFLDNGLVIETGVLRNGNIGRQPINLDIAADGAYAIGISIERDRLIEGVVNLKGEVVHQGVEVLSGGETPEIMSQKIVKYITSTMENEHFVKVRDKIAGVGIGVPGPLHYTSGEVVSPPNLPNWSRVPFRDYIQSKIGKPVVIENNATASAIGEHWRGKWLSSSFLYCYWGIGIGGGLITNGEVYRGVSGNAVEFGHLVVEPHGRKCDCGGEGCLERYASIPAILHDISQFGQFKSLEEVVTAAATRPELLQVLKQAGEYFAQALISAINLFDVDLVIIGGYRFPLVQSIFLPILSANVRSKTIRSRVADLSIKVSSIGEESTAIGAASLVFHELLLSHTRERNAKTW